MQAEGNTGTQTVAVDVARLGDLMGAASVDYNITAGTADAGDFVAESGTLNFASGEAFGQILVTINSDTELEGSETIEVT